MYRSKKQQNIVRRWLFPHPKGTAFAVDLLKQTTIVDDWTSLKELLPTLEEQEKQTVLCSFLDRYPPERQEDVVALA